MSDPLDKNAFQDGDAACTIDDYAVIGDCRSAALISRTGSLDWLCWPCFDSPAIFAGLLDRKVGGQWQICPVAPFRSSRRYLGHTSVLETRFETSTGILQVTDFMPIADEEYKRAHLCPDHKVIRIVTCLSGEIEAMIKLHPRPE